MYVLLFGGLLFTFSFLIAQNATDEKVVTGRASYYGIGFHGRKTANGEIYNKYLFTAAHRKYKFGTYVNVKNIKNGLSITVRINDRGPYNYSRIIDLSEAAARRIGSYAHGLTQVEITPVRMIRITPEIEEIFACNEVVDCLGNPESLGKYSISLYKTNDLIHMIYISNELYLHEDVEKVYISSRGNGKNKNYHLIISDFKNEAEMIKAKDYFERKGFMEVSIFK
jgi:rare lipoprotein A